MRRLEEIKNEYAKKRGYKDFNAMYVDSNYSETNHYINVIAEIYAEECCVASLDNALKGKNLLESEGIRVKKYQISYEEKIVLL